MKTLAAFALVLAALAPAVAAQTAASFTGKWEGTFTMQRSDEEELATDDWKNSNFGRAGVFLDPRRAMISVRLNLGR